MKGDRPAFLLVQSSITATYLAVYYFVNFEVSALLALAIITIQVAEP